MPWRGGPKELTESGTVIYVVCLSFLRVCALIGCTVPLSHDRKNPWTTLNSQGALVAAGIPLELGLCVGFPVSEKCFLVFLWLLYAPVAAVAYTRMFFNHNKERYYPISLTLRTGGLFFLQITSVALVLGYMRARSKFRKERERIEEEQRENQVEDVFQSPVRPVAEAAGSSPARSFEVRMPTQSYDLDERHRRIVARVRLGNPARVPTSFAAQDQLRPPSVNPPSYFTAIQDELNQDEEGSVISEAPPPSYNAAMSDGLNNLH